MVPLLAPIALFGIIFPIQFWEDWLTTSWSVVVSVVTPLMLIFTIIAESFAGERERHTLETLLTSRLPDRAIFFGKLLASIIFGRGMTLFHLLVSLGVMLIFGTDSGVGMGFVPGFSLHGELQTMVDAAFTPYEAIAR